MKVSELAREAGISPSGIRYWEALGILPRPKRRANGYREYTNEDLARLRLVLALRRLGLDSQEAGRIAELGIYGNTGEFMQQVRRKLDDQRRAIAARRAELDALEAELVDLNVTAGAVARPTRSPPTSRRIAVLFVCTGNSARSQMAEALLRTITDGDFDVMSAGTQPRPIHPLTVRVLREIGIDIDGARSKSIDEGLSRQFDYVITVCDRARRDCPRLPGRYRAFHWGLDDPVAVGPSDEERLSAFRRTREDLRARLLPFIELARRRHRVPTPPHPSSEFGSGQAAHSGRSAH